MKLAAALLAVTLAFAADADHDSLSDDLEQRLLDRFAPTFLISAADCDARPARFAPDSPQPQAVDRDGAIYGQAFPHASGAIELHYYHLWSRDCGRASHPLDVEHVAALVEDDRATHWFAAAHQATACDAAHGARAEVLAAIFAGPTVWISHGKHASYFSAAACSAGCGTDRCERMTALLRSTIVNIGEPGAPLNGALWTASGAWPLAERMQTDFPPATLAQLDASPPQVVRLSSASPALQGVIATSSVTADGIAAGGLRTDAAVNTAGRHTDSALRRSFEETGQSLERTRDAVVQWFRGRF